MDELESQVQKQAERSVLLVDGFGVPTGERTGVDDLYSGKHHTCEVNVQFISDLAGRVVEIGDPLRGSVHDARAFKESGIAKRFSFHLQPHGPGMIGDKAYIAAVPVHPYKKPEYRHLTAAERRYNRWVNSYRAAVERGIAHMRCWRILKTRYRRPLTRLSRTLRTVTKLEMYRVHTKEAFE